MTAHSTWTIPGAPVVGHAWEVEQPVAVILLSHGLAEYAQRFYDRYNGLIPALNQAGYSVYSYDLRGHGDSAGDPSMLDAAEQVADHQAARRALRALRPDLPLYLFSHSVSSVYAAAGLLEDPSGVDGVIMHSPSLKVGQEINPLVRNAGALALKVVPGMNATARNVEGLTRLPAELDAYHADPRIYKGKVTLKSGGELVLLAQRLVPHYPNWRVPTLLLYGTADRVNDMRGIPDIFASMGSSDKTLHAIEGGYHELLNDADRDRVLALILEWLEARKPQPQAQSDDDKRREQLERLRRLHERHGAEH